MNLGNKYKYIEESVRDRKTLKARHAIKRLVKHSSAPELIFQCCDWFRRLGLLHDAWQVLKLTAPPASAYNSEHPEGRRLLWGARILNLMGASPFALKCLHFIQCDSAEAHRIAGNIFLENWEHASAHLAFTKMQQLMPEQNSYGARLQLISLADAESGVGRRKQAIERVREILKSAEEPLLRTILQTALGEYLARDGSYREAYEILQPALASFQKHDRTADHGIGLKWHAYVLARLGKKSAARENFAKAWRLLYQPSYRAEVWLDLLRLQGECGLLSKNALAELYYYPGLPDGFLNLAPAWDTYQFGHTDAWLLLDLTADEYFYQHRPHLGVPLEVRLIALLRQSAPYGINKIRAMGLLWPEEPFSLAQLRVRLDSLLTRVRSQFKIEVGVRDGQLRLSSAQLKKIAVRCGPLGSNSFLRQHTEFQHRDLKTYYQISDNSAWVRIREWLEDGKIDRRTSSKFETRVRLNF